MRPLALAALLLTLLVPGAAPPADAKDARNAKDAGSVDRGDDSSFDLEALRGKVVYLDFWASWCAPCRKSFPWLNRLQEKYADEGLVVVGVNVDRERSQADVFLGKHPADFRIVYDPEGKIAGKYDLKGMPSTFMIDRAGHERAAHVGFRESETETLEKTVRLLLGEPAPE